MPTWRCPHCGTPQTETARCWVCRRSSTACGTCRHFRRSVAAQLGYCGLDRRRAPLIGDEIRACWESTPVLAVAPLPSGVPVTVAGSGGPPTRGRDFVEVDRAPASTRVAAAPTVSLPDPDRDPADAAPPSPGMSAVAAEPGWNLWGDLEA